MMLIIDRVFFFSLSTVGLQLADCATTDAHLRVHRLDKPFVHSHNLSYQDLLLEQSSVQLVKAVPWRQHRGHKEMIHGLYKLYRGMMDRQSPNHPYSKGVGSPVVALLIWWAL